MKITDGMMSATAYRNNTQNKNKLQKDLEKLSSGYMINRAGDNAAGLVITERMRSHISGYTQAVSNAQDGVAIIRTFEGALGETQKILIRFKSLAAESANGVYSDDTDRAAIELEYKQLLMEIDDIAETEFNGIYIRDLDSTANIITTLITTAEKPLMRRMALRAATPPEPTLTDNIKSSWLTPALDKIKAATGLTLSDDITLELKFDEDTNGVMECVAASRGADGRADALTLLINPAYINAEEDFTELESKLIDGVLIDNIFASALVQGVLLSNIESPVLNNNPRTPVWFTKGLAEAAIGNNSFSDANTRAAAVAVNNAVSGLSATNAASTVNAGNGGFLFLHYLDNYGKGANKQGAYTAVNGGRIKDLCEALKNADRITDSTATFDKAFTATYGMTWQNLLNQFKTQVSAVANGTGMQAS
jgi:flagellin-like hook-associated protein FlgL